MEYTGKNKSPYYGVWQTCLLLIIVPIALFAGIYFIFEKFQNYSKIINCYGAMGIGFGVGSLFHISCIIAGLFKGLFSIVINRIAEFFSNLSVSFKFAFKLYIEDLKTNGMVFWIYFVIVLLFIAFSIYGFIMYFSNISF